MASAAEKAQHLELARQHLYVWRKLQDEWLLTFRRAFQEEFGRAPSYGDTNVSGIGNNALSEPVKQKLRDINSRINHALDAAYRHYKASGKRSWAKFKESDTPTMKREKKNSRAGSYASHSAERHDNPGDIHIDIHSHNTKGRNVRAKNPKGTRFERGDHIKVPFTSRIGKIFRTQWRDGYDNVPGVWAHHIGFLQDDGEYSAPRWYNEDTTWKKVKARAKNPAGSIPLLLDRLDMMKVRAISSIPFRETMEGWSANVSVATLKKLVRELENSIDPDTPSDVQLLEDMRDVLETHAPGRMKNPTIRRGTNPVNQRLVLVLIGSPKGRGYYTGKTWDTEKKNAVVFDTLAGAKRVAQKLSDGLPNDDYRIEVQTA